MVHRHQLYQPLVVCVFLVACMLEVDGFLSPVVWSRIAGGFRFFGNREGSSEGEMMRSSRNPWLGRYARSPSYATSPLSIAAFGDDSLRGSLFDELKGLENKLQMAMNLGKYDEAKVLVTKISALKEVAETPSTFARQPAAAQVVFQPEFQQPRIVVDMGVRPDERIQKKEKKQVASQAKTEIPAPVGSSAMDAFKRHSDITTQGIRVEVFSFYQPSKSAPSDNQFSFVCNIRITNYNDEDIQILNREWKIYKCDGSSPEFMQTHGVYGEQPVVPAGKIFNYHSDFTIRVQPAARNPVLGRIEGYFNVATGGLGRRNVQVVIAPFYLILPPDTFVLA